MSLKNFKEKNFGICHLCLENKEMTYEHYPPKSAFNKNTSFYSIAHDEYLSNFKNFHAGQKIQSKIFQGGVGGYCLCEECNNFLGTNYVKDYVKIAKIFYSALQQEEPFKCMRLKLKKSDINLFYFLKQIAAIFICCNDVWLTERYPELLEFVRKKESKVLDPKFRFYLYLNDEGELRNGVFNITNLHGEICEFVFPPFGLVLNINNSNTLEGIAEITSFKNYEDFPDVDLFFNLNKYPTYSPIPLDFRTKEEINSSFLE